MSNHTKTRGFIDIYLKAPLILGVLVIIADMAAWAAAPKAGILVGIVVVVYYALAIWLYKSRKTKFEGLLEDFPFPPMKFIPSFSELCRHHIALWIPMEPSYGRTRASRIFYWRIIVRAEI